MTATTTTAKPPAAPSPGARLLSDALVMTKRNLLKYTRIPTLLLFSTIQPVMFVLLFVYVFGGAIQVPGTNYTNFLMAGVFVQTAVFGSSQTGVGLADASQVRAPLNTSSDRQETACHCCHAQKCWYQIRARRFERSNTW